MTSNPEIPFHQFSHQGPVIHFAHANGFPPETYQQFLNPFLKNYKVIASKFRPLWGSENHADLRGWETFADDMIRFLDEQGLKNIIGIGHSLGGVSSLIAASKRPDLFSKLILLDPVVFDKSYMKLIGLLPHSFRKKIIPIAKIALKRKSIWDSKAVVFESWRKKKVFKRISDTVLKDLIEFAVREDENEKMSLAYSKEWEAQVYITAPIIFDKIKKITTRLIVVKGADTNVITSEVWKDWQAAQPQNQFLSFAETGHLLPFEKPELLARQLLELLDK